MYGILYDNNPLETGKSNVTRLLTEVRITKEENFNF